ncbi:hypothetical protein PSI17_16005, partial [Xenorhabdus sp. IM139775]
TEVQPVFLTPVTHRRGPAVGFQLRAVGGGFRQQLHVAAGLYLSRSPGVGLAPLQRDVLAGAQAEVASGIKLTAQRLLPLAADGRHPLPGLFHAVAGAVAHRPGNNRNVPRRGASGGGNIQIITRTQAEMTGGFQFRPAQLDNRILLAHWFFMIKYDSYVIPCHRCQTCSHHIPNKLEGA